MVGDTIWFGKYKIIKLLGEGATAKVYLAEHILLNQLRAVKTISKKLESYEQIKQEAQLLIQLKSPYIPLVFDVEEDNDNLYIIEEYVEGESLLSFRGKSRRLSEVTIIELTLQICELIQYLHSMEYSILYLDLKPSNLMISNGCMKLIDFGAARRKADQVGKPKLGTRGFAAPEQYSDQILSETCDLYGIGMLICYLATGNLYMSLNELKQKLRTSGYSNGLYQLILKAIKHNPCERYQSVKVLIKRLENLRNQKRQKNNQEESSKKIALIGSQGHIGVTHLAFELLSYLTKQNQDTLYVECNESNILPVLCDGAKNESKESMTYQNCKLAKQEWLEKGFEKLYDYIIYDYGIATNENQMQFLSADIKIVVIGGAAWELRESSVCLQKFRSYHGVSYVVNHVDAKQFYFMAKQFQQTSVHRMPYEYHAFAKKSKGMEELLKTILEL